MSIADEYDSPWKQVLERFFALFLAFFFPVVYQDIDWSRGYEFLDTELQEIVRDAEIGPRRVDKLPDYEQRWQELEESQNPFAIVVMAHLRAMSTSLSLYQGPPMIPIAPSNRPGPAVGRGRRPVPGCGETMAPGARPAPSPVIP